MPPFAAIRDEHFQPAYEAAMERHRAEIAAIVSNPDAPTFANTIEALERAGEALGRVASTFGNWNACDTSDTRQAIEREIVPVLTRHSMAIVTDAALFARIDALWQAREKLGLNAEQEMVLEDYHRSFVRAGAALDDTGKARMTEIAARLSELYTQFSQNILNDEKAFQLVLEGERDLAGLPDFVRAGAAQAAADRGLEGKYVITLARSSVEPFLTFSERRDLREQAYRAYISRGEMSPERDNRKLIPEILRLRAEKARLIGYETYAEFRLDDVMAKTPRAVRDLLTAVWDKARAKALEEQDALERMARADGSNDLFEPWDWRYYSEKRRKAEFDIDGAALKPYFQLDRMIEAAFHTANRLFGLTFTPLTDVPVYHPDVRAWEVTAKDGRTVGLFIGDYFQRPNKRGNAWMSAFRSQERLRGERLPIIVNVMNFTKGSAGEPSLLSLDDARTLFHEFGHGLHGLLSDVTYPSLSGTSVDRDFVELPSQLYENWLLQRDTLKRFARHAVTGEPIPDDLIDRILASQTFNQGFATVEYTASSLIDMELHEASLADDLDIGAFEAKVKERIEAPRTIELRHRPPQFMHIFAGEGYAAGYYTYLWAEVMEADAFGAFEETGDIYDPATAERLRKFIYSSGGTMRPEEAYAAFRGRMPEVGALMQKRGLMTTHAAS
jgi:peptidyl-dipeptidase Dcp